MKYKVLFSVVLGDQSTCVGVRCRSFNSLVMFSAFSASMQRTEDLNVKIE